MFNANGRGYPDVATLGHNFYVYQGGAELVDGTSCAAPTFAGILALLNAYLVENGKPKLGFATPLLYTIGSDPTLARIAFNDITKGDNKCTEETCCEYGFSATTGWDATTGFGTPNVSGLVEALRALFNLPPPSAALRRAAQNLRNA
jgi:tripeptidyl-peptidase-1